MRFQKALFMSNFGIDMGLPEFRVGSYANYLLAFSETFKKATHGECKFLLGSHTLDLLTRKSKITEINETNTFVVKSNEYAEVFGLGDEFILESYNNELETNQTNYKEYFETLFDGWIPDVIFSWEFPTTLFRKIFPDALVLDVMPGAYMRPPYPKTISIDPVGLYKNSFLKNQSTTNDFTNLDDVSDFLKIREVYADYFTNDTDIKKVILDLVDPKRNFDAYWLVPLQVSGYFGFYENCKYKDQFDFLLDVLAKAPKNVGVIATQYIGALISEKTLTNKNLGYIRSLHSNFLYSTEFEKLDNVSQYITPWVESVITVSSTLGFQALLHGKRLESPSTSHLSYLTSSNTTLPEIQRDALIASIFCRQNILVDKFIHDTDYFLSVLNGLHSRSSDSAFDVLAALPKPPSLYKDYISLSPFSGADNQIKKMGGVISSKKNSLRSLLDKVDTYEVISFDIFDTLLRRTLFKPEDVFTLVQKKLEEQFSDQVPRAFLKRFPELRMGFERQLRKEHDELHSISDGYIERNEEFYTSSIYHRMLSSFGISTELATDFLQIEKAVEFSVLEARSLGKIIYNYAIAKNKRVILVSDFTHTSEFVADALTRAGYVDHEKLYVSSEIGLKKHSGNLFKYVISNLDIPADTILHIGDNSIGDFLRAIDFGVHPTKISSTRERTNNILKNRNLDTAVFDNSLYLRTAANLFSEEYLDALLVSGDRPLDSIKEKRDLFSTPGEFGFLAVGPVIYEFTKWTLEQALNQNCTKVVYFARDCSLPYEMAKQLTSTIERYSNIEPVYLAVSRKALTCLNIREPNDCFKVRIDDFSRNSTLADLLSNRFKIDSSRVSESQLKKWNISSIDILIKETTLGAVYGLVHEYLVDDWEVWQAGNRPAIEAFEQYLKENGLATNDDIVAVDFGYKGSAHSVVAEYFSGKFIPLFFMTYSGELGGDPYPNAQAYLFKNMNVRFKTSTSMISHNLIIETILNEPVGSLAAYKLENGQIHLEREEFESDHHAAKIRSIHNGALSFSKLWTQKIEPLNAGFCLEQNTATYILTMVLAQPTNSDLEILRGLVFDNAYAGAANSYILSPRGINDKDVWKEGVALLKKTSKSGSPVAVATSSVKNIKTALTRAAGAKSPTQSVYQGVVNYKSAKSLHRSQFLQALSGIAFPGKEISVDQALIDLVPSKGKNHAASSFLKSNGGIWASKLSFRDKIYLTFNR